MRMFAYVLVQLGAFVSIANASLTVAQSNGFCDGGFYPFVSGKQLVAGRQVWGSYCQAGGRTTGVIATSWFKAPDRMRLYIAGYPNGKDLEFALVRADNMARRRITLTVTPAETWHPSDFEIPKDWRGRSVRLEGVDQNKFLQGWFAFSEPVPVPALDWHWRAAVNLGARTLLHFFLGMLPCAVVLLVAVRRGIKEPLALALLGLAALAAVGYGVFWAWFFGPRIGRAIGFLLPILSVVLGAAVARRLRGSDWRPLRSLMPPLGVTLSATLLMVFTCFVYGGLDNANATGRHRFAEGMPIDNELPFLFATRLIEGNVPSPLISDWLASDRPPLQTGMFLAHMPYLLQPRALDYTIIGIALQSLWLFALWIFLSARGIDRRLMAIILAVCLFSGFTFLNSIYVWPKLLAAAYMIAGASVLLGEELAFLRNRPSGVVLAAVLMTFGLLAHGGTAFAIVGLLLLLLLLRQVPHARSCGAAVAATIILYLPWSLYQKLVDPPGDRLLKWHIAGTSSVTPRPFTNLLVENYRKLMLRQVAENKISNLKTVLGDDSHLPKSFADTLRGVLTGGSAGANTISNSSVKVRGAKGFISCPNWMY